MAKKESIKLDPDGRTRAECFLLCDFAQAENGKLYIVGGGWDQIVPWGLPLDYPAYFALKLVLPGEHALQSVSVRIVILDANGREFGEPVYETRVQSLPTRELENIEGHKIPETDVFMAFPVLMTLTEPGRFILRLLVDEEPLAETSFMVSLAPLK